MSRDTRPLKIGLLGPFGGGNLGDAATQQAIIENIRIYCPGAEIHGFSLNPWDTETRHGIPSFLMARLPAGVSMVSPRLPTKIQELVKQKRVVRVLYHQLLRTVAIPREIGLIVRSFHYIQGFDMLIVSGGGQLLDYWYGAFFQPYALLKWALLAKLRGTKVLFVSVGAGPIKSRVSQFFIKRTLSLASYRSYRDETAKQLIDSIGFHRDDPVYPDLAFSLNLSEPAQTKVSNSTIPVIGINPMTYFDPRIWPERDINIYNSYLGKLAQFVAWLVRRGHEIVLFPGEAIHDRYVINDLMAILAKDLSKDELAKVSDPPVMTVDELVALLATIDIIVASRFHGVVLAQRLCKPVLALTYHPKTEALMVDAGLAEYSVHIEKCDMQEFKHRFESLETRAPEIREQLRAKVQEHRVALEEQYTQIFSCLEENAPQLSPTLSQTGWSGETS
jgi:polysaccharide pyruvyl transferase WcaK-like protein